MRAPATGAHWQLTLFGGVRADSRSTAITHWPSRAAALLLARLALAPQRAHPREELTELLWPGADPGLGKPRLRQVLSTLRALLETPETPRDAVIVADRQAVRLVPGALGSDVARFEHCVAQGDAAGARQLHAGDFMPGYYDDWVVEERYRLAAMLEGLPAASPAAAAAPGPAFGVAGIAAAPPATAGPTRALPSYWTRAFGQETALAQLRSALYGRRLLTVLGPGGSGKTRLSVAVAEALQADSSDRQVIFVPLAEASDAASLWRELARALAPSPDLAADSRPQQTLEALALRPTLLVLDNVEQLDASAVEAIASLLAGSAGLQLLTTSRRRLGLDGEAVFEMPSLVLPAPDASPADAGRSAAVALFVDRARALRAEFHLTPGNVAAVVSLVQLLAGMPLAIELAASRLRGRQPADLLAQLSSDAGSPMLDLLARPGQRPGGPSRHASMRHVLAWSWRQLSPPLQRLLEGLSVPGETLGEQMTAAIAAALGLPAGSALAALLDEAVDSGLLRQVAAAGEAPLYAMPPPVREYAAETRPADLAATVRRALRRWLAAQAAARLPAERTALWPDLRQMPPLLLHAAADGDEAAALDLALAARSEWQAAAISPDLMQALSQAVVASADAGSPALASAGHELLAMLHHYRADTAAALRHVQQALALAPDDWHRAAALHTHSALRMLNGEALEPALALLDQAQALARSSGNQRVLALTLRLRGLVAVNYREDYATAEAMATECRAIHEATGDVLQARSAQVDIAVCWAWLDREAAAAAWLETAFAAWRREPPSLPLIAGLCQLGRIQLRLRRAAAAEAAFRECITLGRQCRWQAVVLRSLLHLPEAWALRGFVRQAALLLGHAEAEHQRCGKQLSRAEAAEVTLGRQWLEQSLGADTTAALLAAGAQLDADAAWQLLDEVAAAPVRAA